MTTRPRPPGLLACGLLLAATLIGACTVSSSSSRDDRRSDLHRQVMETDRLALDLTDGLTREEAGLAPGEATVTFSHEGGRPLIDTTITLPGERAVQRAATLVSVRGESLTDPEARPTGVEVVQRIDGVEAARGELLRSVDELDLPRDEVEEWMRGAATAVATSDPVGYQTTVFRGPPAGDVRVEVEAALAVDRAQVGLRHIFTFPA